MKQLFPHISRIFSASLWLLLLTLIGLNIFLWVTQPLAYSSKLTDVYTHPLSWDAHVALARALWEKGPKDQALEELHLAAELFPGKVLGAETSLNNMIVAWQNEPIQQKQREEYWQNTLARYPDYRDAYVQLAALSYNEGNLTQAHAYLLKALILDPNNVTVARLSTFTSKLLE